MKSFRFAAERCPAWAAIATRPAFEAMPYGTCLVSTQTPLTRQVLSPRDPTTRIKTAVAFKHPRALWVLYGEHISVVNRTLSGDQPNGHRGQTGTPSKHYGSRPLEPGGGLGPTEKP
jgi:hypothetical protein